MEIREEKLVILGSGAFAVGAALSAPDALILEEGSSLAPEFITALNPEPYDGRKLSPAIEAIRAWCENEGCLDSQGRIYLAPVQAILAQKLLESPVRIGFRTNCIGIQKIEDAYLVRFLDCEGLHAVRAKKVLDTRMGDGPIALCAAAEGKMPEEIPGKRKILPGRFGLDFVVKWALDKGTGWTQARRYVHEEAGRLDGLRLEAVAPVFAGNYDAPVRYTDSIGVRHEVAASWQNLFAGLEGGYRCASVL